MAPHVSPSFLASSSAQMSQWGCDMLPSGVLTGGQDSWDSSGTCSNAVNSPGAARSPGALLGGLLDIWDVTKSLLWGVQLMWVLRCLLRKV